jgi:ankyrin repeat protein
MKQVTFWLCLLLSAGACRSQGKAPAAVESAVPAASSSASSEGTAPPPAPLRDPLLVAAKAGDVAALEKLLAQHADVSVEEDGHSAIALAAAAGHKDAVALLLRHKAPMRQVEQALIAASGYGELAVVNLLLDKKVSPNVHDEHGITPLILAGYAGQTEVVQALLKRKADPNQLNSDQEAPLHTCAAHAHGDQIVPLLLKSGARVDAQDKNGRIPLNVHAQSGNTVAVRALLDAGSDLEHRDRDQQTPLFSAAIGGHDDTVAELLARGAQFDGVNGFGATPLIAAASNGHLGVVQKLVAAGAKLDARLPDGRSLPEVTIEGDHVELLTWLLDHGVDPRGRPGDTKPPIMIAAYRGSVKSIRLLVARGADPNLLVSPEESFSISPLMGACATDHEAAARALLDVGAKATLVGKGGASALHIAAVGGSLACVRLLLANGAPVDCRNDARGTPLRSAAEGGHLEIVKFLLARGANPKATDAMGLLPIDYARRKGHTAIVAVLGAAK